MDCDIEKIFDPYDTRPLKIVSRALEKGRIAHAYLITGPDAAATSLTASAVARLLLCSNVSKTRNDLRPCKQCIACKKVLSGVHPDLLQVEPSGATIKIDQIKDIQRHMAFPPLEGDRRVAVINQAESMGIHAANALLKTLEEPPGYGHLILAALNPKAILQTIVSRCQHLHLGPMPEKAISSSLVKIGIDHPYLLHLSEGSIARAGYLVASDTLKLRDLFIAYLQEKECWEAMLMKLAQRASQDQESFKLLIHIIASVIHDVIILSAIRPDNSDGIDDYLYCPDKKEDMANLALNFDMELLEEYADHVMEMEVHLSRNANKLLMALSLLLFWKNKKFGTLFPYGK